jgi:hypothetical protein
MQDLVVPLQAEMQHQWHRCPLRIEHVIHPHRQVIVVQGLDLVHVHVWHVPMPLLCLGPRRPGLIVDLGLLEGPRRYGVGGLARDMGGH